MRISNDAARALDGQGFLVLPGFMGASLLDALQRRVHEVFIEEGERAGVEFKREPETRRLANMVNKAEVFRQVIGHPGLLPYVRHVLGPEFKLSSLNVRSAEPRQAWTQPLHCDMGALPDERGHWVCNTVWMLDDFTPDNGAIRMVPGTHRSGKLPQEALSDPTAPHPAEVLLTGAAGTVVVMNAHLWHGALANRTDRPRTALHAFYCRRDRPQQQYQKRLLAPDVQASLSAELRELLALDDSLNDRLSGEVVTRSGFLR